MLRLAFIDIETTGHDPLKRQGNVLIPWHEIIEVGAVVVEHPGLRVLGEFETKVIPEHPERCLPDLINDYPARTARGEWGAAIPLDLAISKLLAFCGQFMAVSVPAGQNFFFDWSFLTAAFAWCGIDEEVWKKHLHYTRLDTRSMAVQEFQDPREAYDPAKFSLRNAFLSDRLGIPPEPVPHKALNGARQALAVFRALEERKLARSTTPPT